MVAGSGTAAPAPGSLDRRALGCYVLGRRTPTGGYCFYRMPAWGVEEPNAPDTLAALESLRLLDLAVPHPDLTGSYLRALQDDEGRYPTLTIGWAALRGLAVLGQGPVTAPVSWLLGWMGTLLGPRVSHNNARGTIHYVLHLLELLHLRGIGLTSAAHDSLRSLLDVARDSLGGWVRPGGDLETMAVAIRVAALAELPLSDPDALGDLLRRCEDPALGLRPRPDAATTSAGALWGGLVVARALGACLQFPSAVAKNLALLQRSDGGIGARHRAISTLRDTWRGLEAATLLDQLKEENR